MAEYSGIYLHYEGTDAQCSGIQQPRELTYPNDLDMLRYLTAASGVKYFYNKDQVDTISGYLAGLAGTSYWVLRDATTVTPSGYDANITGVTTLANGEVTVQFDHSNFRPVVDAGSNELMVSGGGISLNAWSGTITIRNSTSGGDINLIASGSTASDIRLAAQGDVFSKQWQQWTPTVSGFKDTANLALDCWYKTIGDLVFVKYSIENSGTTDGTCFTLPVPISASQGYSVVGKAGAAGYDDSPSSTAAYADMAISVSGVKAFAFRDQATGGIYGTTDTGEIYGSGAWNKWLCGQFWYNAA